MDLLKRELAPVTEAAWMQIDQEARRVLQLHLAGRRLVDFSGPHGWELSGVNTGRLRQLDKTPVEYVGHAIRDVQPIVELRTPISLDILELDHAGRGARDLDLGPVVAAAERLARAEDSAIFHGLEAARITGIVDASPHSPIEVASNLHWPSAVSAAKEVLRLAGVGGPYALALGSQAYDELTTDGDDGYPIRKRIAEGFAEGSFVWAPALRGGAVLVSQRGGDFELVVGQDLSIGYASHDLASVQLYLTETFAFRVLEDTAAVFLQRNAPDLS